MPASRSQEGSGNAEGSLGARSSPNTFSPPVISIPKGGGAIRGIGEKFAANPVTGTGSMTVPIATSQSRSDFGPQLSLSYDSGAGNGPFGFGWSLSTPAITRKTDKGLPQYRDAGESDVYILSGAEDLVPVLKPDGTRFKDDTSAPGFVIHRYRPRIEGLFARIERWTDVATGESHWRSITRDNITTLYGKDNNSRIFDPADADPRRPARIFTWLICQSYDDHGNAIIYKYAEENDDNVGGAHASERNRVRTANRYLKRIKYGNRKANRDAAAWQATDPAQLPADTWMFEVAFDYGEGHYAEETPDAEQRVFARAVLDPPAGSQWLVRQDPFSSYRACFELRTYRLCRRVLMFHHFPRELGIDDCLVRSTEFSYSESPVASFITGVTQSGYVRRPLASQPNRYLKKSLPPLEFEYSQVPSPEQLARQPIREVDLESLKNLPIGLDGAAYQWVDLDGEGSSGILTEQTDGWFYKRNLSANNLVQQDGGQHTVVRFGPSELVAGKPSIGLAGGAQFLDLAADGQADLVQMEGSARGFYERTDDAGWSTLQTFDSWPNVNTHDPDLKFVDLTGDGHADILITEADALIWYPSLAEDGFGPAVRVSVPVDEEKGARLIFSDGVQSIYLADLSGDGLSDLARIRNGEVCYWPNLGYGGFGAKITMDNAPLFDSPDQFDQRRIRLADIDGSGTTDILYLRRDGVQIYFNESGNAWSEAVALPQFPPVDNISSVQALDLLGNGTACLVWSSPLPGVAFRPMRYLALMEEKPHLLVKTANNLGAETVVQYAPSTKFYLDDKRAGEPWITRLPFPVHVVERAETHDRISRNRLVTRYAYHHGYFDGVEREFRGFGRVDHWDTEELGALAETGALSDVTNLDPASNVPPVLTRTWFHTGIHTGRDHVSDFYAGLLDAGDEGEYYREPGSSDDQARELLLDDTVIPGGLTVDEEREACRALKGLMLRQEVYALDGTGKQEHPYTVAEQNFTIERLQPKGSNHHAVFFTHARETLTYHYERNPADPRIQHALTLKTDSFGNVIRSAVIGYRRRDLPEVKEREQKQTHATLTVNRFANRGEESSWYRAGVPVETRAYEIVKGPEPLITDTRIKRFSFEQIETLTTGLFPVTKIEPDAARLWPYEKWDWRTNPANAPAETRLRLIEHVRTLYRKDDLTAPLALGEIESLALPFESYKLAFTPSLLRSVFGGKITDTMLSDEGRYVHSEADDNWWIPSGRIFYSFGAADTAARELDHARAHFFLPHRHRDPFHTASAATETIITYDSFDLLVQETRDALGNRVTVGERDVDPARPLVRTGQDYRVLQPALMMDSNRNQSAAVFDALGLVAGTAVMGKPEESPVPGDKLTTTFEADLTKSQIDQFFASPKGAIAATLLGDATTRIVYDLTRYWREPDLNKKPPTLAATLARETHASEPAPPGGLKIQVSFSYSDGFGREIQKKMQAEPGPAPKRDADGRIIVVDGQPVMTTTDVSPRWVGNGWTVFNNKGKPVRKYEPFFTDSHRFEFDVRIGVSPVLFYDPAERVVGTLHANHTWEKVVIGPWKQETWDVNDTATTADPKLADPKNDPDVGDFFRRLSAAEYLPTWFDLRTNTAHAAEAARRWPDSRDRAAETGAARKAAVHAGTPTLAHFDSLGRAFLTVAHNRFERNGAVVDENYATRIALDIEANQREVIDARGHAVVRYDYDMLGNRIHQKSPDAGERWMLNDVAGKPLYAWDSRDHRLRTVYDQLHRLVESRLLAGGAASELRVMRTAYGETQLDAEAHNLRGKAFEVCDQAGVVTTDRYDFKGNLLRTRRQLATEYKQTLDWPASGALPLETEVFESSTRYDALNRPTEQTAPDKSVISLAYNEANLIEKVDARLRGALAATPFVTDIDYDAKGQRTLIDYGNGVRTTHEYDRETFRLTSMLTTRGAAASPPVPFPDDCPEPPLADWPGCQVQNLHYAYDPIGNISHIRDDAQQKVYFDNRRVEPSSDYTYDAIYRLIEAAGREHLGAAADPTPPDAFNGFHTRIDHPGSGNAMGTYVERYAYDSVGNIMSMRHRGSDPAAGWKRCYQYATDSNRLLSTSNPADPHRPEDACAKDYADIPFYAEKYEYDAHGNIMRMPHLPLMQWDYRDQLQATSKQVVVATGATPVITWYAYDATGRRVRKITESEAAAPATPVRKTERVYLGGYEVYREYNGGGTTVKLERETLHIMDDKQRVALVETRTIDASASPGTLPSTRVRYQLNNHLGSSSLELDDKAAVISYEEYYPYGSTSYQATKSGLEVSAKRYRYTGKERDEETGFYYHDARYYAPWLGRWASCDPLGLADGVNQYQFVRGAPVNFIDSKGKQAGPWQSYVQGRQLEQAFKESPTAKFATEHPVLAALSGPAAILGAGAAIELGAALGIWALANPKSAVSAALFGIGVLDPHPPGASPLDPPGPDPSDAGRLAKSVVKEVTTRLARSSAGREAESKIGEKVIQRLGPEILGQAEQKAVQQVEKQLARSVEQTALKSIEKGAVEIEKKVGIEQPVQAALKALDQPVEQLSKNSLKHIGKHLEEFKELDPSMTLKDLTNLGLKISGKAENLIEISGGRKIFQETVKIGEQTVKVRTALNTSGHLNSVHIRTK